MRQAKENPGLKPDVAQVPTYYRHAQGWQSAYGLGTDACQPRLHRPLRRMVSLRKSTQQILDIPMAQRAKSQSRGICWPHETGLCSAHHHCVVVGTETRVTVTR